MSPGILLGMCVIILAGPNKGIKATAVDYKDHIYKIERIVNARGLPWIVDEKIHEDNLRQCTKEEENE